MGRSAPSVRRGCVFVAGALALLIAASLGCADRTASPGDEPVDYDADDPEEIALMYAEACAVYYDCELSIPVGCNTPNPDAAAECEEGCRELGPALPGECWYIFEASWDCAGDLSLRDPLILAVDEGAQAIEIARGTRKPTEPGIS